MNRLLKFMGLMATGLLAVSCLTDGVLPDGGKDGSADEVLMKLRVKTPALMRPATRAIDIGLENGIERIMVFTLTPDAGGVFTVDKLLHPESVSYGAGNTATFTVSIPTSTGPTKLIVAANCQEAIYESLTEDQIRGYNDQALRSLMVWVHDPAIPEMPMYGEKTVDRIVPKNVLDIEIPMMRALARVDMRLDLQEGSPGFVPQTVALYRFGSYVYALAYLDALNSDKTRVTAPSGAFVPMTTDSPVDLPLEAPDGDKRIMTAYLPESAPPLEGQAQIDEATCLVVGGYWNGSEQLTYYRIDFNSGEAGHPFGQILRNYRYVFSIVKVSAPGLPDPLTAATSIAGSMTIDVEEWDENGSELHLIGDGDYVRLSDNSLTLPYNTGGTQTFTVRSTVDIAWELEGASPSTRASLSPATQSNADFTVTANENHTSGNVYTDYNFTVTALSDNNDLADDRRSTIDITAGGVPLRVVLTQTAVPASSARIINVLSLSSNLGSMGTWYDPSDASPNAPALRNLLVDPANFGQTGTVKVGGFIFEEFQTADITSATTVNATRLRTALAKTDILIMPYGSNPDLATVNIIKEWLTDPHHVVFMSCDAGINNTTGTATNVIMRNSLGDGLTWTSTQSLQNPGGLLGLVGDLLGSLLGALLGDTSITAVDCMMADPVTVNAPFIGNSDLVSSAAFGPADQGQMGHYYTGSYPMWNDTGEWAMPTDADVGSSVIPLAIYRLTIYSTGLLGLNPSTTLEKTDMMLVGVDPGARIVYIGESDLVDTYLESNPGTGAGTPGTPGYNNISTLMCNIWAWAVNTVMSE